MKHEMMKTNLMLMVLGSLLALAVVSCQSTDDTDTSGYSFQKSSRSSGGPGGNGGSGGSTGGGQGGPGGNMQPPQLAESTELLLKIENLAENTDPLLVITKDQGEKMIPVLMEWKEELEANQNASTDEFMNVLNGQLSVAQTEYEPQMGPPGGQNGRQQGPPPSSDSSSDRPMGPPSDVELLTTILDKLS